MDKLFCCLLCLIALWGCATKNSVLFVTKTSLGVDIEAKPSTLNIAYDRTEGYFAPRYENGAVPPVLGQVQTDGGVFNAKVKQLYATGNAAETLAKGTLQLGSQSLKGEKKLMFFGTSTTTGLKIGFTTEAVPDSFLFGFKRTEFSFIPIGSTDGTDHYPSVLATYNNFARGDTKGSAGLQTGQFFATGLAADYYANDPDIKAYFRNEAKNAFTAYYDAVKEQNEASVSILRCYIGVREDDKPKVWEDANRLGLFREPNTMTEINEWYKKARENPPIREENLLKADRRYVSDIYVTDGSTPLRIGNLKEHKEKVCEIARTGNN